MTLKAQHPSGAVERVVRAAGRLSPGVWRQLGKWLRTREGTAGPWDPDDPPVLAQIANEVDEIADALAALRGAPAPHEQKAAHDGVEDADSTGERGAGVGRAARSHTPPHDAAPSHQVGDGTNMLTDEPPAAPGPGR